MLLLVKAMCWRWRGLLRFARCKKSMCGCSDTVVGVVKARGCGWGGQGEVGVGWGFLGLACCVLHAFRSVCNPSMCNAWLCNDSLLRNAWLCHASRCTASLCNASLCNALLCKASMRNASLCNASLCRSSLCHASLCELIMLVCVCGSGSYYTRVE